MGDLESLRNEYVRLRSASAELQSNLARVEAACAQAVLELGEAGRSAGELLQHAESKLHKSEQLLSGIFEGALDAMLLVGEDHRYVDANPAALELFGLRKEEIIGHSTLEFCAAEFDVGAQQAEFARQGRVRGSYPLKRGNGESADVEYAATANVLPGLHLVVMRDATSRKRLEDQLKQAQKMEAIGRLAGGVAHDFNNMLTVILSYSTFVLAALTPDSPAHADVTEISKAAARAANLTRQLLTFSRQQIVEPKVIDVAQALDEMRNMLRRLTGEDIEVSVLADRSTGRIRMEPVQFEQVIINLVVNARDAMPLGGKLTIETANMQFDEESAGAHLGIRSGPYVMVAVSDTGSGMNRATQARIFEPFFTTKEAGKGTGLGLSTVFGIVRQSGGGVWVYSEVGQGTTFKIYLPRTDAVVRGAPTLPPAASSLRGSETVLLVEDEEQVRHLLHTVLARNGYNVLEAQNGGEAFLICERHETPIHVLLTDVVMPKMSGPELAQRLLPMRKDMKTIYMSGYADGTIVKHGVLHEGTPFLQKPITPESLLSKLREVLDG